MTTTPTAVEIQQIRKRLRGWFKTAKRNLPWRRTRDPYAIWISEVMLQQTQVAAVIPFYERFIGRFPTIASLARASEQEVLCYWEGLGYYRRARHLHQTAQILMKDHGELFPHTEEELKRFPGLGCYTTAAILSQAFDARLPAVDANVTRVLCRLAAWKKPLEEAQTKAWLWETTAKLLPRKQVGEFNQALMELGQTVCLSKQPMCLFCPVKDLCRGRMQGIAFSLPNRRKKPLVSKVSEVALIIRRKDRLLLCQRQSTATRWSNMWEFPTKQIKTIRDLPKHAKSLALQQAGYQIQSLRRFGTLHYCITRFQITLIGIEAKYLRGKSSKAHYQNLKWVKLNNLRDYPLSVPQRKMAALWLEQYERSRK